MGKLANNDVLDALGNYLKTNGIKMTVCEGAPTTYEHASSNKGTGTGKVLAGVVIDTGDYTLADGTTGRKVTFSAQVDVPIDVSGTVDHVAVINTTSSALLFVTTCTSQPLVATNTVTIPAWAITSGDPT
jgi:hypothetical protein